jgi:hypothetical protein
MQQSSSSGLLEWQSGFTKAVIALAPHLNPASSCSFGAKEKMKGSAVKKRETVGSWGKGRRLAAAENQSDLNSMIETQCAWNEPGHGAQLPPQATAATLYCILHERRLQLPVMPSAGK